MSESYRALCTDFYVNLKLGLKLDLPRKREEVLEMFERARRQFPALRQFRRYPEELALESDPVDGAYNWIAIRSESVRSGSINPSTSDEAYALHRHALEAAPYYLGVSPLDVDHVELLFGFDLLAEGNHDAIVFNALLAGSPMSDALQIDDAAHLECQPMVGFRLTDAEQTEAIFEVRTRARHPMREARADDLPAEPISVYLTLRRYGPIDDVESLPGMLMTLAKRGEALCDDRVVPQLVVPLRDAIGSGSAQDFGVPSLLLTTGVQPQQLDMRGMLLAIGLMIGAIVLLSIVLLALRRRMLASGRDQEAMGLFEEIRRLHASGELTDDEYEQARQRMIARVKGESGPQ